MNWAIGGRLIPAQDALKRGLDWLDAPQDAKSRSMFGSTVTAMQRAAAQSGIQQPGATFNALQARPVQHMTNNHYAVNVTVKGPANPRAVAAAVISSIKGIRSDSSGHHVTSARTPMPLSVPGR